MKPARGVAFGLELEAAFDVPGLDGAAPDPGKRLVRLALASEAELGSLARAREGERISHVLDRGGRPLVTVDAFADRGFLMWADGFGSAWVAASGSEVLCAPADLPAWRWQRFLIGQVLPFAAVLHGLEVFHASAVVLDGRAIAVVAASGSGKTSLALNLVLGGLDFLNDDVLVLESRGRGSSRIPASGSRTCAATARGSPSASRRGESGAAWGRPTGRSG